MVKGAGARVDDVLDTRLQGEPVGQGKLACWRSEPGEGAQPLLPVSGLGGEPGLALK